MSRLFLTYNYECDLNDKIFLKTVNQTREIYLNSINVFFYKIILINYIIRFD